MHRTSFKYASRLAASLCLAAGLGLAAGCGGDDDDDGAPSGDAGTSDDDGTTDDGTTDDDGGGDGGTGDGPDAGPVAECEPRSGTNLGLERVAVGSSDGFDEPVFVTSPPDDARLFVVSKHGAISIVKNGRILDTPFLDIDDRVTSSPAPNEQGLLGLAFHPDFASNGRFFVLYTGQDDKGDDFDVLSEFHVDPGTPDVADPTSERRILPIRDGERNHNGGMIAFGEDNYLYIGLGDGGGSNDQHGSIGNGQDKTTLLGDFLRIDIEVTDPPGYGIPTDNPYFGSKDEREEIWLSGVRNPWRWSFDRQNGDLYIGDVGQGQWEEVNVLPAGQQAGANLGWRAYEGEDCFDADQCPLEGRIDPVAVYPNPGDGIGAAIVGGYVYRGTCFPDIQGWYFYGDYLTEQVWKLRFVDGEATEEAEVTKDIDPDGVLDGLSSFGEDAAGEIYAVSMRTGEIFRIVAGP